MYDKTPDMPTSEVGLRMSPIEDVYVVLNGWEDGGNTATFTIYINPLTTWMWVGGLVLVLGTLIAAWPHVRGARRPMCLRWRMPQGMIESHTMMWIAMLIALVFGGRARLCGVAAAQAGPAPVLVEDDRLVELLGRKEAVMTAIKDLEFDYQVGKLSDEDYQRLRPAPAPPGDRLIQQIEQVAPQSTDVDAALEAEIAQRRTACWSPRARP